jgi:hypothetical protein
VIVKATLTDAAVSGTVKEQRATPALNACVCATALPPAVGLHDSRPWVSGRPVSERVTFAETVSGRPATTCAGAATPLPITGFTTRPAPLAMGKPNTAVPASARIVIELTRRTVKRMSLPSLSREESPDHLPSCGGSK